MADLDAAIREWLHLDDPAEDSRDLLDDWDAAARALLAVLDLHKSAHEQDGDWEHGPYWPCEVCHDGPWPCATVRVIAEKLGVEADSGRSWRYRL